MTAVSYAPGSLDARKRETAAAAPLVAAWLRHIRGELAPGTLLMRSYHADKLLAAHPGKQLGDFTEADLEAVRWDGNLSDGAWANHVSSYRSLFREYALERGLIDTDPTKHIRRPKTNQRYLEVFTDAEVEACLGLPNDPDEDTGTGEDGFRMTFVFDSMLRIGELCRIRDRDVQPDRRILVVLKGKGSKDRVVPMTERLCQAYSEWRLLNAVIRDDFVFGHQYPGPKGRRRKGIKHRREPLHPQTLRMWWYDALRLAGVYREWRDDDGKIQRPNPHLTRHTGATWMLRRGARESDVAKILGHKNPSTTTMLYGHLVTEDLFPTIDLLERV